MQRFRNLAIGTKLMLVMMFTACAAVFLAGLARIVYEVAVFHKTAEKDLSIQAEIIGDNCAAALEFDDARTAQETLASLRARTDIMTAVVYRKDGSTLARFLPGGNTPPAVLPLPASDTHRIEHGDLRLFHRVVRKGEVLGTVYLRSNLQPHYARLHTGIIIALGTMLVSSLLALFLAARLQRIISEPILGLADLAERVGNRQDYSLRAVKQGDDEIGALATGFNRMLEIIQERDATLQRACNDLQSSEERFRQLAEEITEVFWMTNPERSDMIYVSPGYQKIWGRSCNSLYTDPQSWLKAVHPDDRERIVQAVREKQINGTYDEEYRIMRPDGGIRWVHDRAFPVRDASGAVYRLAGIAEDITDHKRIEAALRELSARLLKVQDDERRRIARDLHESTAQNLAALGMCLGVINDSAALLDGRTRENLAEARILTKECSREVRTLSYLLHPPLLDNLGLVAALRWYVEGFTRRSGIQVELALPPESTRLPHDIELALFRIVQECLTNTHHHAESATASIRLTVDQSIVLLEAQDTGRGLPAPQDGDPDPIMLGVGMASMSERVTQLGGRMAIVSPGRGVTVRVTIPLKERTA